MCIIRPVIALGSSYSKCCCENTLQFEGLYVPPFLKKGTFVFFAVDNTDFAEDTAIAWASLRDIALLNLVINAGSLEISTACLRAFPEFIVLTEKRAYLLSN